MYDICIFDLDGTLSDPYDGLIKGIVYATEKHNLGKMPDNPGCFIGPPLQESFQKFFGLTQENADGAVATFREYYAEKGLFENELYPGISELLRKLKEKGVQLAVATSKPDKFAHRVLEYFGIYKHFDYVIGDEMDGSLSRGGKEKLIRAALDALDPERSKKAVMIGDRNHDIYGGKAVGIDTIAVAWGYGSEEEHKLAGATHTATGTDELLRLLIC